MLVKVLLVFRLYHHLSVSGALGRIMFSFEVHLLVVRACRDFNPLPCYGIVLCGVSPFHPILLALQLFNARPNLPSEVRGTDWS